MNLSKVRLLPYALTSLIFILLSPVFYPTARLSYLIPCLIILFYQKPLISCLWASFFAALFLDLLSSNTFLGLHVTSYCAATAIMYPQKRHFFADNLTTLPILTFLTSIAVTAFQGVLVHVFQGKATFGAAWYLTNLLFMPLLDSAYAFTVFLLPFLLFGKPRRHGNDFFLHKSRGTQ